MTALLIPASLSAEVIFRDDFTSSAVRPEWEVVGEDSDCIALDGEHFLLLTTTESRGVCYQGELPKEYSIESRIIAPPQHRTTIGLYLIETQENFVTLINSNKHTIHGNRIAPDFYQANNLAIRSSSYE
jgi:hypothetical protein